MRSIFQSTVKNTGTTENTLFSRYREKYKKVPWEIHFSAAYRNVPGHLSLVDPDSNCPIFQAFSEFKRPCVNIPLVTYKTVELVEA